LPLISQIIDQCRGAATLRAESAIESEPNRAQCDSDDACNYPLRSSFMRSKISPLAAVIAASTLAGSLALAQSEETPPPSSSTQGSMPQESSDYPGDSSTRDPAGAPGEATGSMGEGANAAAQIDQRKVE